MTISCLHHINIQTTRLEETRDFYERVLGLYVGARPEFGQEGYWLFVPGTDQPVVHLSPCNDGGPEQTGNTGNRLEHVAFFGRDVEATVARLEALGVPFDTRPDRLYLDCKMIQIFLKDPNGINVELGFFPARDEMFRDSMAEYQGLARAGDKTIKTKAKAKPKSRKKKPARDKLPA